MEIDNRIAASQADAAGIIFVIAKRYPRTKGGLHRIGEQLDLLLRDKRAPGPGQLDWLS